MVGMFLSSVGINWDEFKYRDNGQLTQGVWTHLATTWDGSTVRFFMDGTQLAFTPAFAGPVVYPGTVPLSIGTNGTRTNVWLDGALDDVRLYDHALTGQEIRDLFLNIPEPTTLAFFGLGLAGLVAWPHLTNQPPPAAGMPAPGGLDSGRSRVKDRAVLDAGTS